MQTLLGKRVVLITGKGGVGRTSVTAALAHVAQRSGKRVLVAEIHDGSDGYSPLAQLFGFSQLPRTPELIAPGIDGSQLRPDTGAEQFLGSVLRMAALVRKAVEFEPLRRLFLAVPSLRELGVFFHLLTLLRARDPSGAPLHELILVDMPATGHTLALTGLPQVILRLVSRGPIADALREGQSYLNAPDKAGAYVVTLPEELPVTEALELLEGLASTAVPRGGLFVNRVPSSAFTEEEAAALDMFLAGRSLYGADAFHRIKEAARAIERLRGATDTPLLTLTETEQRGPELVRELADALQHERFSPASLPAAAPAQEAGP